MLKCSRTAAPLWSKWPAAPKRQCKAKQRITTKCSRSCVQSFSRSVYTKQTLFSTSTGRKVKKINKPFPLELGGCLPEVEITWEEWGKADNKDVVVIFPSLSVGSHARSSVADAKAGWWEVMMGPDRAINTEKFRVICPSGLGSPFGTTSPLSIDPRTQRPYGKHFPQITPKDIARCHRLLLDSLGIEKVHGLVGASLGGCVALSFASEYSDFVDNLCVISCTGKTTPGSVALRHVQRQAILTDPDYCSGDYLEMGKKPTNGMAVARQIGMITYRTREEFNQKFNWNARGPYHLGHAINFDVEKYLLNKAKDFVNHYDANCYLLLSKCTDLMDLARGHSNYSAGLLKINSRVMIMGVDTDYLIPISEQQHMYYLLQAHGKDVRLKRSSSIYGHDAFLLDFGWFSPHIQDFLDGK